MPMTLKGLGRGACALASIAMILACNAPFGIRIPLEGPMSTAFPVYIETSEPVEGGSGRAFVCTQPAMTTVSYQAVPPPPAPTAEPQPSQPAPGAQPGPPTPSPRPSLPISAATSYASIAFLELPFPYDSGNSNFGGSDDQFRRASQRRGNAGRINSFFDHLEPLYPPPDGREPADPPAGGTILTFEGNVDDRDYYSGHPAFDYSTFEYRQPTTPVFAAADGVVVFAEECCGGSMTVKLKHTVEGVGEFMTIYMHLHPDEYFEATRQAIGSPIAAGTRIGTMGNTGHSTGHHLHFEVRFDANRDGQFTSAEVMDPYGFRSSADYPQDPWGAELHVLDSSGIERSVSPYLWIHPLGVDAVPSESGGGQIELPSSLGGLVAPPKLCAPPGSLPVNGTISWSWSAGPAPTMDLSDTGNSFDISASDSDGNQVTRFDPPLSVQIPYDPSLMIDIDLPSLGMYWYLPIERSWILLPAAIDLQHNEVILMVEVPGRYSLMGRPTRDLVPPEVELAIDGPATAEGEIYGSVTMDLSAFDPSGVTMLEYSLDGGTTWQGYTGPFELQTKGIPHQLSEGEEATEDLGGGRGSYLVLVSAADGAGNVIDPPMFRTIRIDPSKNPDPTFTSEGDVACRSGPGTGYSTRSTLPDARTVPLEGRNAAETWWWITSPAGSGHCWVAADAGIASGDTGTLPVIPAPTPVPSPTPTITPVPLDVSGPSINSYSHNPGSIFDGSYCSPFVSTVQAQVSDPSGVASVTLFYRYFNGASLGKWAGIKMSLKGSAYEATLSAPSGVVGPGSAYLEYYIHATDSLGNTSQRPSSSFPQITVDYCLI